MLSNNEVIEAADTYFEIERNFGKKAAEDFRDIKSVEGDPFWSEAGITMPTQWEDWKANALRFGCSKEELEIVTRYTILQAGKAWLSNKRIAPENRTKPMSYRKASAYLGSPDSQDSAEWLAKCVADGTIRCEHFTRQTHVFDRTQFPAEAQDAIRPKIKST